jgi:hypothetical protein
MKYDKQQQELYIIVVNAIKEIEPEYKNKKIKPAENIKKYIDSRAYTNFVRTLENSIQEKYKVNLIISEQQVDRMNTVDDAVKTLYDAALSKGTGSSGGA